MIATIELDLMTCLGQTVAYRWWRGFWLATVVGWRADLSGALMFVYFPQNSDVAHTSICDGYFGAVCEDTKSATK